MIWRGVKGGTIEGVKEGVKKVIRRELIEKFIKIRKINRILRF